MAYADPRVADWPMVGSPFPGWILCVLYLIIVFAGNKFMKNREPLDLKNVLIVYNVAMVLLSTYMAAEILRQAWILGYGVWCNDIDFSEKGTPLLSVIWLFYISKYFEFFDTFFFVARKKTGLITFLHLYHHTSVSFLWWIGVKFAGGGECYPSAAFNSAVHAVMYTYYAMAAMGRSVWWKKYLTQLQMIQFMFNIMHAAVGLALPCVTYPRWMLWSMIAYMSSLLVLFGNYYRMEYVKRQQHIRAKKDAAKTVKHS